VPENYFAKVPVLPLKYNLGHPVDRHPVSNVMDPTDITKVKVAINCLTCHQPHASAQPGLLVKDQANNSLFCASLPQGSAKIAKNGIRRQGEMKPIDEEKQR
jgi:predicted CXXCH cytochrome family protein